MAASSSSSASQEAPMGGGGSGGEEEEEEGGKRNWAELPRDVLSVIYEKITAIRVLCTAQAVCRPWRRLALEPQIWRCVDMTVDVWYPLVKNYNLCGMARTAVDRSAGQLVEFSMGSFATDELLQYVAERTTLLRCLRLESSYKISENGLLEFVKKFPLLEELELSYCSFSKEALEFVGQACPQLKCFSLDSPGIKYSYKVEDEEALAIAKSMPELRELHLLGNSLTRDGLLAILDGCPHLESLDLRQCFNVKVEGNLCKRCEKIRDLRLPNDKEIAGDDSDYDDEYGWSGDFYDDYSDIDVLYEDMFVEHSSGSDFFDSFF